MAADESEGADDPEIVSRRSLLRVLVGGTAVILAGGAVAYELIEHQVLPGKLTVDRFMGACDVPRPPLEFQRLGPSETGQFYSAARHRFVGYTIGWPPGHRSGDQLPLVIMLHGDRNNHRNALAEMSPAQAVALRVDGQNLRSMALVTVDGGNGYWTPHPLDDPMGMVVDELIPFCQRRGLGVAPHQIGLMGISMGGYGALDFAERFRGLFAAVAAISPAIWTSYAEAQNVNPNAFASETAFDEGDVITHAAQLRGVPVRIASAYDDPFFSNVQRLAAVLPKGSVLDVGGGCHSDSFFLSQEPPSLEFLSRHLS